MAARKFVCSLMKLIKIASVDEAICRDAIDSNEPDFEDGIIRSCAESAGVDFIISGDEEAFKRSPIKRLTAEDYIELFCPRTEIDLS